MPPLALLLEPTWGYKCLNGKGLALETYGHWRLCLMDTGDRKPYGRGRPLKQYHPLMQDASHEDAITDNEPPVARDHRFQCDGRKIKRHRRDITVPTT
jgi:hypothetical protein